MFGCCKYLKVSTCTVSPMSFPFVIHFDNLGSKKHSSVDYNLVKMETEKEF